MSLLLARSLRAFVSPEATALREERMKRAGVGRVGRRDLVRGGGAIALAGALDALFAAPISSQAQQAPVSVPVVDRLAVRVLVDSYQIAVAPSFKIGNVQVERFGWPLNDAPPDKALV